MDLMIDIDTVAEVIWQADRCHVTNCRHKAWGWENLDARHQEIYRRMAQAAIEAMELTHE